MNRERVERLIRELLEEVGAPGGSGLSGTPGRVAESLEGLAKGARAPAARSAGSASLRQLASGMTIARDLEFLSVCEHHLLPFFGRCHIGLLDPARRLDLEELGQLIGRHARRLQLQERLTDDIAHEVSALLAPEGVAVAIEAQHLCMMMRGVGKQESTVSTSSVLGLLRESAAARAEFFALIGGRSNHG
ncbi:MAG: GTP cyclohydrolase I [Myxococcaceae bacterium]